MVIGRPYSAGEKLTAVNREIGFRKRVYARRVAERKMTQEQMDREIDVFQAIGRDYEALAAKERLL